MANIGTITDGYLFFNAQAGKTYEIKVTGTSGEFSSVQDAVTGDYENASFTGGNPFDGTPMTFTASRNFQAKVYLDGGNVISFEVLATSNDVETLLNDTLESIKNYVDTKDESVKTFAQGLIDQLMQTTDLQAKLQLLNEINSILDGDSATAGFQLWESNVVKLNQINIDLTAAKSEINTLKSSANNPFISMKSKAAVIFAV